jgi:hypothetical protein
VSPAEERVQVDLPATWSTTALVVGVVALAACALCGLVTARPELFFRAYLVAYMACLGICLGSMVLRMIGYLTNATWAFALTPILESSTRALPLVALLFLPLLLGLDKLYPWETAEGQAIPMVQWKLDYLNTRWFIIRAVICLAVWNGIAWMVGHLARRSENSGSLKDQQTLQLFCGFGLVLYGATFTLAAVDWFMSLEPQWWSAIYAVMLGIGQILMGLSFSVLLYLSLMLRAPAGPWSRKDIVYGEHYGQQLMRDFGNLLLTFTIIWTYMSFSQYLLIYSGNLKEEAVWYMPRTHGGWQYLIMTIGATQFGIPFMLLLNKELKRNPRSLVLIALLIFCSRFLDITWLLVPAFPGDNIPLFWMLPMAFVGLGGIWAALFLYQIRQRVLVLKLAGNAEVLAHE